MNQTELDANALALIEKMTQEILDLRQKAVENKRQRYIAAIESAWRCPFPNDHADGKCTRLCDVLAAMETDAKEKQS